MLAVGWGRSVITYTFFVLLGRPFPVPLARETRLFLGLLLFFLIGIYSLTTSPTSRVGYIRRKKIQGTHCCHSSGPKISSQSVHFSPPSSFLMYVLCIMSRVFRCPKWGRNRDKWIYPILCQKWK